MFEKDWHYTCSCNSENKKSNPDKAKPRVIVGRLPAVIGGRPAAPEMAQAGKATGPDFAGQPGCRS
jgi:hypothetical protein